MSNTSPLWALHDTPFGKVAVKVNRDGSFYADPAFGLGEDGWPDTGFGNTPRGLAGLTVNGRKTHSYVMVSANPRFGDHDVNYPENNNRDPREWVGQFSSWDGFTPAAQKKLSAWFTENHDTLATPQRIAEARLRDAIYVRENAQRERDEAEHTLRAAEQSLQSASAELEAARAGVEFGNSVNWVEPVTEPVATTPIYVVSQHEPESSGGFWWLPAGSSRESADSLYDSEVASYQGTSSKIRLVLVDAPAHLKGEDLTAWLDSDIDAIEVTLPALREVAL